MGAKGLTGFSGDGGVETKVALLRHEGRRGMTDLDLKNYVP